MNFRIVRSASMALVATTLLLSPTLTFAKTHTVPSASKSFDGAKAKVAPGDVICLEAGSRSNLILKAVVGSKAQPVVIKNCGGQVRVESATSHGILVVSSQHFRLLGDGDAASTYGIYIGKTPKGSQGLALSGKSSDYEVAYLEIEKSGFAGIMSKTDPSCADPDLRGFVQRNTHFHHNYIHDVGGEGFYVGYSWWPKRENVDCGGTKVTFYPHAIEDVSIHHNIIERTGWDALQMGCAHKNARIHHNVISDYGLEKVQYQTSGMQINAGTAAHIEANELRRGEGGGLIVFGLGGNRVINNLVVDAKGSGIYVGDRADAGTRFVIAHNTIVRPKDDGIRFASRNTVANLVQNNLVSAPGSGKAVVRVYNDVDLTERENLLLAPAQAGFVDLAAGDFHLQKGSPAENKGADVSALAITDDLDGLPRPDPSGKVDVGAYERHDAPPQKDAGTNDAAAAGDAGLGDASSDMQTNKDGSASADSGARASNSDGCAVAPSSSPSPATSLLAALCLLALLRRRPR